MTATSAAVPHGGLVGALHVAGPAGEHAEKLMTFGRFVGSWDLAVKSRPIQDWPLGLRLSRFFTSVH